MGSKVFFSIDPVGSDWKNAQKIPTDKYSIE